MGGPSACVCLIGQVFEYPTGPSLSSNLTQSTLRIDSNLLEGSFHDSPIRLIAFILWSTLQGCAPV